MFFMYDESYKFQMKNNMTFHSCLYNEVEKYSKIGKDINWMEIQNQIQFKSISVDCLKLIYTDISFER